MGLFFNREKKTSMISIRIKPSQLKFIKETKLNASKEFEERIKERQRKKRKSHSGGQT